MENIKRATSGLAIFIVLLCLQGCEREVMLQDKPEDFICTDEQLELVKKEFEICNKSTYMSSYCFLQAKKTHCERRGGEIKKTVSKL